MIKIDQHFKLKSDEYMRMHFAIYNDYTMISMYFFQHLHVSSEWSIFIIYVYIVRRPVYF